MRKIRVLDLGEIETLLDWAAAEGWNPGLGDARAFQAADPQGFLGAFVGTTMVAAIAAVAYDETFGFIGLYICHPDWRGQGHGRAVWDAGMAHLGERTVGLDGVAEQQANYASMGFVPAYQTVRMTGTLAGLSGHIRPTDLSHIHHMDRDCFPARRDKFINIWSDLPNITVAQDGGFAVLRQCRHAGKIGPLFAPSLAVAMDILAQLSGPVDIDVPAYQTEWMAALAAKGFTPGFTTTRMYRGPAPSIALHQVFAVTSLELG